MPEPKPPVIRVHGLAKRYGAVAALSGLTFEVGAGEVFGLLGLNGAGKTTAIECVLGLRDPDGGAISVGGFSPGADRAEVHRRVGAQLQGARLQDRISPRRALRFFAGFHGRADRVAGLLERFGLGAKADTPFCDLSAGQRQRLLLALALVNDPPALVLDEPTAGLDPMARRELHGIIAELRAAGAAVLLSTHDLGEAAALCDRVAVLHGGSIVAQAAPADLAAATQRHARLLIRTERPLDLGMVAALPGVASASASADGWLLVTSRPADTAVAATELVRSAGNALVELRALVPTLEDAFASLTAGNPVR